MKVIFEDIVKVMVNTADGHYWIKPTREEFDKLLADERVLEGKVRLKYLTKADVDAWEKETGLNYEEWKKH